MTFFFSSVGGDAFRLVADMEKVEQRISGSSGLDSRVQAWNRLWDFFEAAPVTGKAGWWNSTNLLPTTSSYGVATSPHNLYIRLLSEVGIIGLIAVLSYPVILAITLLVGSFRSPLFSLEGNTYMFLFASIVSVFVGQIFEDRYLVGIMSISNGVVIFVLIAGLYEIVGESRWQK